MQLTNGLLAVRVHLRVLLTVHHSLLEQPPPETLILHTERSEESADPIADAFFYLLQEANLRFCSTGSSIFSWLSSDACCSLTSGFLIIFCDISLPTYPVPFFSS